MSAEQMVTGVIELAEGIDYEFVTVGGPRPRSPVAAARAGEPRAGLGRLRLRGRVRHAGEGGQRRGDAGARQLRGRPDALPRPRHRPRLGADRRRDPGADGTRSSAVRKGDVRGLRRASGLERLGERRWRKAVARRSRRSSAALEPDYVVLGGGNASRVGKSNT